MIFILELKLSYFFFNTIFKNKTLFIHISFFKDIVTKFAITNKVGLLQEKLVFEKSSSDDFQCEAANCLYHAEG